jgi:hypothetical protein
MRAVPLHFEDVDQAAPRPKRNDKWWIQLEVQL